MIRDIRDRIVEFMIGDRELEEKFEEQTSEEDGESFNEYGSRLYNSLSWEERASDDYKKVFRAWIHDIFEIVPIALTREQIERYNPPPNPAKITDPRASGFIDREGSTSWEVDALKPEVLNQLLEDSICEYIDEEQYEAMIAQEDADKVKIKGLRKFL